MANGGTDYSFDPHTQTIEMLANFNIIPRTLLLESKAKNCTFKWNWFYLEKMLPWPETPCLEILGKAIKIYIDYNVYNLLQEKRVKVNLTSSFNNDFSPQNDEEEWQMDHSFDERERKYIYRDLTREHLGLYSEKIYQD